MAKSKHANDIQSYHARAMEAAKAGLSMKEFAKQEGTLANNVQARLYEAVLAGLPTVQFREPERGGRRRRREPDNTTQITLYTGRAKTPYLTLKVPTQVVEKAGNEGDLIEWDFSRGRIVGRRISSEGVDMSRFQDESQA
jgi:hypothetical protein